MAIKKMMGLLLNNHIPFLTLDWNEGDYQLVEEFMLGGKIDQSNEKTEAELLKLYGKGYVQLFNLGRSALYAALKALNLPEKSEIIIPSFGCLGIIEPILKLNLVPKFVDINQDFNPSLESVLSAISNNTKAIIYPHHGGKLSKEFFEIVDRANQLGVYIVEDAAQSQGLREGESEIGTFGDVGVFSQHGGKSYTSSGGGWLFTKNEKIIRNLTGFNFESEPKDLTLLRIKGMFQQAGSSSIQGRRILTEIFKEKIPWILPNKTTSGWNPYKVSQIESALVSSSLDRIQGIIDKRISNAKEVHKVIKTDIEGGIKFPNHENHIYSWFGVWFNEGNGEAYSKIMKKNFNKNNIEMQLLYKPLHLRTGFENFPRVSLKMTEIIAKSCFCFPIRATLTSSEMKVIKNSILTGLNECELHK